MRPGIYLRLARSQAHWRSFDFNPTLHYCSAMHSPARKRGNNADLVLRGNPRAFARGYGEQGYRARRDGALGRSGQYVLSAIR
jgi:hypothetical protein